MRAHYLQHIEFEGLGSIKDALLKAGYTISCTQLYKNQSLPNINDFDLLIIMGGPMSVNDENLYPWLKDEKKLIKKAIKNNKPILGVCLGAQLIASAMGAKIYRVSDKEIGWFDIKGIEQGNIFEFPKTLKVFHWHGETFDLPINAKLLASSDACQNQAFQIGKNVIGLQFHLETTTNIAKDMCYYCQDELVDGQYIQRAKEILDNTKIYHQRVNNVVEDIIDFISE